MDMALIQTPSGKLDIVFQDYDMQQDDGLRTAILLSLFVDASAKQGDVLPDGGGNKRGFWASPELGSRLWLLDRSKQTDAVLQAARDYADEALLWLVDDGVAQSVDVQTSWLRTGLIILRVTVFKKDGSSASYKFEQTWEQSL